MATKRKATLKQVFNAWLKYNKKSDEAYKAKRYVEQLASQAENYATELITYGDAIYRVTITNHRWSDAYKIEKIAKTSELPTTSESG